MMRIITVILFLLIAAPAFSQIGMTLRRDQDTTGGGGGATFNDTVEISNLYAWYVSSDMDADGIENEETGAAPATWSDRSTNGYDLTRSGNPQIDDSALNGLDVVDFDGAGDYYQASTASDWTFLHDGTDNTIFLVVQAGKSADPNALMIMFGTTIALSTGLGASQWFEDRSVVGNEILRHWIVRGVAGSYVVNPPYVENVFTPNTFVLIRSEIDADNATASNRATTWIDGVDINLNNAYTATPSSAAPDYPLTLGSPNGTFEFTGYFAEVIVYDRHLTSGEAANIETYLNNKYGL